MALKVCKAPPRKMVPAKKYLGILIGIYDLGHRSGDYGPYQMLVFHFELHSKKGIILNDDGTPLTISTFHMGATLTAKQKPTMLKMQIEALTREAITEDEVDITDDLLGKACFVNVTHEEFKGEVRDGIGSVMPLDEDEEAPTPQSDEVYYEIPTGSVTVDGIAIAADTEIPTEVPDWVKSMVRKSLEFSLADKAGKGKGDKANGTKSKGDGKPRGDGKPKTEKAADDEGDDDEGDDNENF